MGFEKGRKKVGGRIAGTPNRSTAEIRQAIQDIYNNNIAKIQEDLDNMKPFQRQQILDKLASRFLPSLTKNENDNTESGHGQGQCAQHYQTIKVVLYS